MEDNKAKGAITAGVRPGVDASHCKHCGARRVDRQIGLERTVDDYVQTLVDVFREVRRVLRKDGTVWLNLGDSYATAPPGNKTLADNLAHGTVSRGTQASAYQAQKGRTIPQGLKPKDLIGIPWRVAFALQADGWWLRSDVIWCLSGGARVYAKTQKGEAPMLIKDLVRLDPTTVKLWNGQKWTQALGWSVTPRPNTTYEIELRSGERIGCTAGHLWPTQRGNVRADELQVGDVIQTCQLPEPEEPETPALIPDSMGWFVGLYLAQGSRSGSTIQIAHRHDENCFDRLRAIARAYGGTCRVYQTSDNGHDVHMDGRLLNALIDTYIGGTTAKDKHLKVACWRRSDGFLRYLLQGYLDGDGHYDEGNNRWRLGFTENDALAADLRTLCARLGYSLRLKRAWHTFDGRRFKGYRGQIRTTVSEHFNNRPDSEVVAIRRSRARQFWDIGVKDEPHLFALASGVLTHNSKPNPMPESVTDRPTKSHEYVFLLTKSERYFYDADAIREQWADERQGRDGSSRVSERNRGGRTDGFTKPNGIDPSANGGRNKRTVWTIPTQPVKEAHFATFPEKLVEPCILAGTSARGACPSCGAPWERVVERDVRPPPDRIHNNPFKHAPNTNHGEDGATLRNIVEHTTIGWRPTCTCENNDGSGQCVVLDPFGGSGTLGRVAARLGRKAILIELNKNYVEIMRKRLAKIQRQAVF